MRGGTDLRSVCRLCAATCGVVFQHDAAERIAAGRGDRDHPLSRGYMCPRGLASPEAHNSPRRILRPPKRMPDGSLAVISLDVALDEIAAKLRHFLDTTGPKTVAPFKGTQS